MMPVRQRQRRADNIMTMNGNSILTLILIFIVGSSSRLVEVSAAHDLTTPQRLGDTNTEATIAPTSQLTETSPKIYLPGASGSGPFEALKDWIASFEAKFPEADLSVSSVGSGAAQAALWGDIDCDKKPVEGVCPSEDEEENEDVSSSNNGGLAAMLVSSSDDESPPASTLWGMGGATIGDELYQEHVSKGIQQLPALGGPILITYSKDVTGDLGSQSSKQLNLNFDTVAGIFNNTITRWNDTAIQATNPDLDLPEDRISVVVRSDKSGMSQTFTESIHHAVPAWPEEGVGKKPDWPLRNLTHVIDAASDTSISTTSAAKHQDDIPLNFKADGQTGIGISLLRRPYSIGYLELGYFSTLTQFVGQAYVSSPAHPKSFVPATVETLKTTMGGLADKLEPETLSLTLVDQDTPLGGYPISRYVYWYIKKDGREYESCYQAWLVYKFIEWTYTDPLAEEIALGHGWVVPPPSVVDKALSKLQEMQCIVEDENDDNVIAAVLMDDDHQNDTQTYKYMYVADYVPLPYRGPIVNNNTDESSSVFVVILLPTTIALLIAAAIGGYVYIQHKKREADSLWIVQKSELDFGSTKECIGRGTFGRVLLAEYRGTKVAVKQILSLDPTCRGQADSFDEYSLGSTDEMDDVEGGCQKRGDSTSAAYKSFNPGLQSVGINTAVTPKLTTQLGSLRSGGIGKKARRYRMLRAGFVLEMRHLAKLRHPNITTTMGAVLSPGEDPMMVMEYMHNGSLYDAIRNETINLNGHEDILTIVQDVAHGLRFLHSANPQVIHGDLKTKNVLIDSNFRAKVADFGLSAKKNLGDRGTPYWMAPELLSKESSRSSMSDIYSFGILLYEVYSRKNPYEGEDYKDVLRDVCDPAICKRPPIPTICPPNIASLMKDCLQHNPADRPTAPNIDSKLQAEGTVQRRVFRIEALNRQLKESNRRISTEQATQLSHFASMSHEIRTPLNCIIGISSLLEEDNDLNRSQKDSVKMIVSSGKLLRHVVDDVLDFSKFVSGNAEIDIKRTDLQDILTNIVTSMKLSPITERKQIDVRTFYGPLVPQYVEMDGRRLQQILYNLLSNAVKFSKEKSYVDLSASVGFAGGYGSDDVNPPGGLSSGARPELRISVKDYGKGIDESDFVKIFQPFAQTETGINNLDGGTGLGLAITKQLVELLGGSISVDSRLGEWTEFSLRFPLTGSAVETQTIASRLKRCCVLLLSNNEEDIKFTVEACRHFKVQNHLFKRWDEVENNLASPSPLIYKCRSENTRDRFPVLLVHEDLYDETRFERLCKAGKTILITFGPKGKISQSHCHYHSLVQVFPSVLMQQMVTLCKTNNAGHSPNTSQRDAASAAAEAQGISETSIRSTRLEQLNILVAEDNLVNQKVMRRLLKRIGISNIQVAENGQIAVDLESQESFDVIFMDVQMPVMGGIESCNRIVSRPNDTDDKRPVPKIIFLSAHVMDDYQTMCMENGATDYMTKPCTLKGLQEMLEKLTRRD